MVNNEDTVQVDIWIIAYLKKLILLVTLKVRHSIWHKILAACIRIKLSVFVIFGSNGVDISRNVTTANNEG